MIGMVLFGPLFKCSLDGALIVGWANVQHFPWIVPPRLVPSRRFLLTLDPPWAIQLSNTLGA